MPIKVKRGLGLLVVALLGWLLGLALLNAPAEGAAEIPALVALLAASVAAVGGLVVGLGMIAWGLLRD